MKISAFPRGFCAAAKRHGYRSAGPVPRDRSNKTRTLHSPRGNGRFLRQPMHGEGQALALREKRRLERSAGPVPRDANCLKQEQDLHDLHDLHDYLPRSEHFFQWTPLQVRRTCMSIEKRAYYTPKVR